MKENPTERLPISKSSVVLVGLPMAADVRFIPELTSLILQVESVLASVIARVTKLKDFTMPVRVSNFRFRLSQGDDGFHFDSK